MSRIRSIHPGIWTDVDFVGLSSFARLLFIGIWNECDDKGIFLWSPLHLKMRILPADNLDAAALLAEIEAAGRVQRFTVAGKEYGAVKNFAKFQRPKKPNDIHPATPDVLAFAGHAPVDGAPAPEEVPNRFPTDGEKSPQMEDGGGKREEEELDASASNGAAPAEPPASIVDIAASIFTFGVRMLQQQGYSEKNARSLIGKCRKMSSDGIVLSCLNRASTEKPSNLASWLIAAIEFEKGKLNGAPAPDGAATGPGPTERAAMAAFGVDPNMGEPADVGAAREAAHGDRNRRALPDAGNA